MARPRKQSKPSSPTVVIGYVRRSTDKQDNSLGVQAAALDAWCEANGATMPVVYVETVSGGADLADRVALVAAIDGVKARKAGGLLVHRRDRFTRDPLTAILVERDLEKAGATIVDSTGTANGDGPATKLQRRVLDAVSEYERGIIRTRITEALAKKKRAGERTGAVPFGKQLAADGIHLVDAPEELATIDRIQALRASGATVRAIVAALNTERRPAKSGGLWHVRTVYRLIRKLEDDGRLVAYPKAVAA